MKFNISDRTLRRWKKWWDITFISTNFWKEKKGLFRKPPDAIPFDLVQSFETFKKMLEFFSHFRCRPKKIRNIC